MTKYATAFLHFCPCIVQAWHAMMLMLWRQEEQQAGGGLRGIAQIAAEEVAYSMLVYFDVGGVL